MPLAGLWSIPERPGAAGFWCEEILGWQATLATFPLGPGVERGRGSDFAPLKHSRGLGTRVLVATPSNRLGPLFMVTQVPLHHVVVPAAPAAIFSELDSCEGQVVVGQPAPRLGPSG